MAGDRIVQDFTVSYTLDEYESEWIRFVVYNTQAGMLDATRRSNTGGFEPTPATFATCTVNAGRNPSCPSRPRAVVRMCRDALTRPILMHETAHAVMASYKWNGLLWTAGDPWGPDNHDFVLPLESVFARANQTIRWEQSTHPHGIDAYGDEADDAVLVKWGVDTEAERVL